MATEANITSDDEWFIGEDKLLVFGPVLDANGAGVDISGWALSWKLKRELSDADVDAVRSKTTGSGAINVIGTYDATLANNTQRIRVTVLDTDTDDVRERLYYHELKRTDAGLETVLTFGTARLLRGVHRS
jgi:hypothetical protein